MKRIKSILTVLMAAVFALSLVPAGAWAEENPNPNSDHGELYTDSHYDTTNAAGEGSIEIKNAKKGETYDIYRIFDLASFNDQDKREGQHTASTSYGEAYSYVIREHEGAADSTTANKWWTFLTTYNKDGAVVGNGAAATPYMVSSTAYEALDDDDAKAYVYFTYEPEAVALTDTDGAEKPDFHAVKATAAFSNALDVTKTETGGTALSNTFEYDKQDYVDPGTGKESIKAVQDFAQDALSYAKKNEIAADYTETAASDTVTVNSAGASNPAQSKVYLGWYLMGTATGTLASLDTTNKNVVLYDKNETPEVQKKVLKKGAATVSATTDADHLAADDLETYQTGEGKGSATYNTWATDDDAGKAELDWVDNTDADVNDLVQFRTVVEAKQGASRYVLHDVMEDGLKLLHQAYSTDSPYTLSQHAATANAEDIADANTDRYGEVTGDDRYDLKVYLVRDDTVTEIPSVTSIDSANYFNWSVKWDQNDGCDFEIEFKDATTAKYDATNDFGDADNKVAFVTKSSSNEKVETDVKDGDKIVVTYWAKVLPTAVVWGQEDAATGDMSGVKDNDGTSAWADGPDAETGTPGQVHKTSDGNSRNTNSTVLTYGAKSHTTWDKAEVTTYQLDVVKTQAGDSMYKLLDGAKFRMYKAAKTTTGNLGSDAVSDGVQFTPETGASSLENGKDGYYATSKAMLFEPVSGFTTTGANASDANATKTLSSYRYKGDVATADETNTEVAAANILTSQYGQEISVHGLEEGWYLLVEEEAPEGFNKLAHPIAIYVNGDMDVNNNLDYNGVDESTDEGKLNVHSRTNDSTVSTVSNYTDWDAAVTAPTTDDASATNPATYGGAGGVHVINNTGQELPSTGGIGTTIFYVAGTVLVVGAVVMLVAKRRMGAEA